MQSICQCSPMRGHSRIGPFSSLIWPLRLLTNGSKMSGFPLHFGGELQMDDPEVSISKMIIFRSYLRAIPCPSSRIRLHRAALDCLNDLWESIVNETRNLVDQRESPVVCSCRFEETAFPKGWWRTFVLPWAKKRVQRWESQSPEKFVRVIRNVQMWRGLIGELMRFVVNVSRRRAAATKREWKRVIETLL